MSWGSGPADALLTAPSAFRRQTVVLAVVLPISALGVSRGDVAVGSTYWAAVGVLIAITVATALPISARLPTGVLTLPLLLDIPAIALLGAEDPALAPWLTLVIPVAWIARSDGARMTIVALTIAAACLAATGWWTHEANDIASSSVLGVAITTMVVASAVGVVSNDARTTLLAQARLLQRQARMLEEALAQARTRRRDIEEILDTVSFAVITITPGREVADLNVTARRLLERLQIPPNTPLTQLPLYEIDGTTPMQRGPMNSLFRDEIEELPLWLGHPGNLRVALSLSANSVLVPGSGVTRVVVAARDITEERAAIAARDDMIASVSHELRTPLSSIIGYVELVVEDPELSDINRTSLDVALKNADRVLRLISDLAQMRADAAAAPGFTVTITRCDIAALVRESLDSVRPLASDRLLSVSVDAPESLLIDGDPFRLRNVADNLLSNAVKYNEIGGWIDITLEHDDDRLTLSISNTGATVEPEELARLFDRFYRPPSSRNSTVHGTGIGLSVVKEIVERHAGTITAASSPDSGTTTFTLVLPLRSEESDEMGDQS